MTSVQPTPQRYLEFDQYIDYQLQKTRASIKLTDLLTAAAGLAVLGLTYLLVFVVFDHWIIPGGFARGTRIAMLLGVVVLGVAWVAWRIVIPYLRSVNRLYAARELERVDPTLKSTLLNLVDAQEAGREVSPAIRRAMEKRAATNLSSADVERAVDRKTLLTLCYALLAVVVLWALYTRFSTKKISTSIWRALAPASATAVDTSTDIISVTPGDTELLSGEMLTVLVELQGETPENVTLFYSTDDRRFVDAELAMRLVEEGGSQYEAVLRGETGAGIESPLNYRIVAGDDESAEYRVTVVRPPHAEVNEVTYLYPKYMAHEPNPETSPFGDIEGYEGTRVTVRASFDQPVARAELRLSDEQDTEKSTAVYTMAKANKEQTEYEATFTLAMRPDGSRPYFYHVHGENKAGHSEADPIFYPLTIRPDLPPELTLLGPEGDIERPLNAKVPVTVAASDPDFLLNYVTIKLNNADGDPIHSVSLLDEAQKEFTGTHDLDLGRIPVRLAAGDHVFLQVEARDNRRIEIEGRVLPGNRTTVPGEPGLKITITEPVDEDEVERQAERDRQEQQERLDDRDPDRRQDQNAEQRPNPQQKQNGDRDPNGAENQPQNGESDPNGEPDGTNGSPDGQNGESTDRPQDGTGTQQEGTRGEGTDPNSAPERGTGDGQNNTTGDDPAGAQERRGENSEPLDDSGEDDQEILERLRKHQERKRQEQEARNQERTEPNRPPSDGETSDPSTDPNAGTPDSGESDTTEGTDRNSTPDGMGDPNSENRPDPTADPMSGADRDSMTDPSGDGTTDRNTDPSADPNMAEGGKNRDPSPDRGPEPNNDRATDRDPMADTDGNRDPNMGPNGNSEPQETPGDESATDPQMGDASTADQPREGTDAGTREQDGDNDASRTQEGTDPNTGTKPEARTDTDAGMNDREDAGNMSDEDSSNDRASDADPNGDPMAGDSGGTGENDPMDGGGGNTSRDPMTDPMADPNGGGADEGTRPADGGMSGDDETETPRGADNARGEGDRNSSTNPDGSDAAPPTNQSTDPMNAPDSRPSNEPGSTDNRDRANDDSNQSDARNPDLENDQTPRKSDQSDGGETGNTTGADQGNRGNKRGAGDSTDEAGPNEKSDRPTGEPGDERGSGSTSRETEDETSTDDMGDATRTRPSENPGDGSEPEAGDNASTEDSGNTRPSDADPDDASRTERGTPPEGARTEQSPSEADPNNPTTNPPNATESENTPPQAGDERSPEAPENPGDPKNGPEGDPQADGGAGGSQPQNQPGTEGNMPSEQERGSQPGTNGDGINSDNPMGNAVERNSSGATDLKPGEKASLENGKQAANLTLDRLKDDLDRGEVDQDLLDELGWTPEQLKAWQQRMQQQLDTIGDQPADGEASAEQLRLEDIITDFGKPRTGESVRSRDAGGVGPRDIPVPERYRKVHEAYTKSISGRED